MTTTEGKLEPVSLQQGNISRFDNSKYQHYLQFKYHTITRNTVSLYTAYNENKFLQEIWIDIPTASRYAEQQKWSKSIFEDKFKIKVSVYPNDNLA